ncbi:hypothetical protein QTP88_012385 [Uroleucon formosanum]
MFVCKRPGSDASDSVGGGCTAVVTNALAAANDDGADVCYTPSRRRILRGGPGSAHQPRHARSIRPGPPTRLCRRYGRTSPSAQTEGRGRTRARVRQLEDVRNGVRRTAGGPKTRTATAQDSRIKPSSNAEIQMARRRSQRTFTAMRGSGWIHDTVPSARTNRFR